MIYGGNKQPVYDSLSPINEEQGEESSTGLEEPKNYHQMKKWQKKN